MGKISFFNKTGHKNFTDEDSVKWLENPDWQIEDLYNSIGVLNIRNGMFLLR